MATLRPLLRTAAASSRARVRQAAGLFTCQERYGLAVGCRGFDGARAARYCVSSFGDAEHQRRCISSSTKGERATIDPLMHFLLLTGVVNSCDLLVLRCCSGGVVLVSDYLIASCFVSSSVYLVLCSAAVLVQATQQATQQARAPWYHHACGLVTRLV